MTAIAQLLISPLTSSHNRGDFHCGVAALDNYLQKQARQDIRRGICRVFVATPDTQIQNIVGYYTLSSLSVENSHWPAELARKFPKHPIPAALLGRLAVASSVQAQGVGRMLLTNAIKRTVAASMEIGMYALIVDALDEHAKHFYQRFGFLPFYAQPQRLFLPLTSPTLTSSWPTTS